MQPEYVSIPYEGITVPLAGTEVRYGHRCGQDTFVGLRMKDEISGEESEALVTSPSLSHTANSNPSNRFHSPMCTRNMVVCL